MKRDKQIANLSREIIELDNIFDEARNEFREDMEDKNRELTKM